MSHLVSHQPSPPHALRWRYSLHDFHDAHHSEEARAAVSCEIETKAMREFFDIMESFESHSPPDGEAILKYIESHRVAFDGDNSTNA